MANIFSSFSQRFGNRAEFKQADIPQDGAPIFSLDDLAKQSHPLAILIRMIFIDLGITHETFDRLHRQHGEEEMLYPKQINTQRNNFKKALRRSKITMTMFGCIVKAILKRSIIDVSITLRDDATGEKVTYSSARSSVSEFIGLRRERSP